MRVSEASLADARIFQGIRRNFVSWDHILSVNCFGRNGGRISLGDLNNTLMLLLIHIIVHIIS